MTDLTKDLSKTHAADFVLRVKGVDHPAADAVVKRLEDQPTYEDFVSKVEEGFALMVRKINEGAEPSPVPFIHIQPYGGCPLVLSLTYEDELPDQSARLGTGITCLTPPGDTAALELNEAVRQMAKAQPRLAAEAAPGRLH